MCLEFKNDVANVTSLIAPSGSTTQSRARAEGAYTGLITETGYFFEARSLDSIDLMRFLMVNDGSGNQMRNTLFLKNEGAWAKTYTHMGMAYNIASGCNMTSSVSCKVLFTVLVTEGYTNNAGVAEC